MAEPVITASIYNVAVLIMSPINYVTHQYTNATQNAPHKTSQTPHKTSPGEGLQSLIAHFFFFFVFSITAQPPVKKKIYILAKRLFPWIVSCVLFKIVPRHTVKINRWKCHLLFVKFVPLLCKMCWFSPHKHPAPFSFKLGDLSYHEHLWTNLKL